MVEVSFPERILDGRFRLRGKDASVKLQRGSQGVLCDHCYASGIFLWHAVAEGVFRSVLDKLSLCRNTNSNMLTT